MRCFRCPPPVLLPQKRQPGRFCVHIAQTPEAVLASTQTAARCYEEGRVRWKHAEATRVAGAGAVLAPCPLQARLKLRGRQQ
mmetsp:Transcript_49906/g.99026  ORF Transcript_49906/g.99026 Transcript_49906/m.99026 type:complete len:82 (-) Transcript_49906:121-366(-)